MLQDVEISYVAEGDPWAVDGGQPRSVELGVRVNGDGIVVTRTTEAGPEGHRYRDDSAIRFSDREWHLLVQLVLRGQAALMAAGEADHSAARGLG